MERSYRICLPPARVVDFRYGTATRLSRLGIRTHALQQLRRFGGRGNLLRLARLLAGLPPTELAKPRDLHALGHGQCRARLRVRTSIFLRTLFPGEISVTRGRFFVSRTIGILRRDRSFPLVPSRVGPVFFCANRQARPKNRAGLKSHSTHPICISHPICRITLLLLSARIV